ncbi:aldehyde dehydrogenase (NAD+) [Alicyclobacillus sacchari]|uniref:Aldehyde dehydrogenase (NAD+) n=1 Tax=Alicyclobacillus sacchari TaxID=392010 RepID=A0A4R8LMW9_9BACL|nr:aldehyde dehydrogenase family protein [Alicyclobacillus sacchari]TDY46690.1 aldehyde dehydrogenase (NAD+) [Alicyclobacillus sacchari]
MESKNWVDGEWMTPKGKSYTVNNPSRLCEEVGVVHTSEEADVIAAAEAARRALPEWAGLAGPKRADVLYKAADLLAARSDEIAVLASREMGKPIAEMKGEVARGVHLLRYYAAEGVRAFGSVIPASQEGVLQYTKRLPLGVVGVITPWNFPVAIPVWKIAPALICGNTIVWKPAEFASLTAVAVAQVFADAGLPAGVLNLIVGDGAIAGRALVEHAAVDAISFTGSTATGMRVAVTCAGRNIKYQTEMGGKNAAVVLADADLSVAVSAVVSGAFRSAGQKCTATSRIIIEKSIYEPFVDALAAAVRELYVGDALDEKAYLGPVASQAQYRKVQSYVDLAKSEASLVVEGDLQVSPDAGYYVRPLVVTGVDVDHALAQEEVFGPIACILTADGFDEAVDLCNRTVYGLSASVFTGDLERAMRFLDAAEAGMVRVNLESAGVEYQAPFGGLKQSSSHTREQGQAALDFYSQLKTCAVYYGA